MGEDIMKYIKRIVVLVLTLITLLLSSCQNAGGDIKVFRKYAGKSENFQLTVESWAEFDGNQDLKSDTYYNADDLYCLTSFSIEYTGESDLDSITISQINFSDANWEANYYGEPNYISFFKNKNFLFEKKRELSCLNSQLFNAEIVYGDGNKETIKAELTQHQGEISDINLSFQK
jgi:hypothetical protein